MRRLDTTVTSIALSAPSTAFFAAGFRGHGLHRAENRDANSVETFSIRGAVGTVRRQRTPVTVAW
jgi:hypothetical protein